MTYGWDHHSDNCLVDAFYKNSGSGTKHLYFLGFLNAYKLNSNFKHNTSVCISKVLIYISIYPL